MFMGRNTSKVASKIIIMQCSLCHSIFWLLLLLILLTAKPVSAHHPIIVKIDAQLSPNSAQLTLFLKPLELMSVWLQECGDNPNVELNSDSLRNWIIGYVQKGIILERDGQRINNISTVILKKEFVDALFGHSERIAKIIPIVLKWNFKDFPQKLDFTFLLYGEIRYPTVFEIHTTFERIAQLQPHLVERNQKISYNLTDPFQLKIDSVLEKWEKTSKMPYKQVISYFLELGFTHVLLFGLDHILFVLGIFLLSTKFKSLLAQITVFTIAHSSAIALALFEVVSLPASIVEPVITVSIMTIAIKNIFSKQIGITRWMVIFGFGLIHGLSFGSALMEAGLPPGQMLTALLSFNLGVELAQISAVMIFIAFNFCLCNKAWFNRYASLTLNLLLVCIGLLWAMERIFQYL